MMKIRSLLLMVLLFCLSVFFCLTGCSKPDTHYNLRAKPDYSHSTMWFDAPNDALAEADIFTSPRPAFGTGGMRTARFITTWTSAIRHEARWTVPYAWPMLSSGNIAVSMLLITARLQWNRGWLPMRKRNADTRLPMGMSCRRSTTT